jgi:hypothetical protein
MASRRLGHRGAGPGASPSSESAPGCEQWRLLSKPAAATQVQVSSRARGSTVRRGRAESAGFPGPDALGCWPGSPGTARWPGPHCRRQCWQSSGHTTVLVVAARAQYSRAEPEARAQATSTVPVTHWQARRLGGRAGASESLTRRLRLALRGPGGPGPRPGGGLSVGLRCQWWPGRRGGPP